MCQSEEETAMPPTEHEKTNIQELNDILKDSCPECYEYFNAHLRIVYDGDHLAHLRGEELWDDIGKNQALVALWKYHTRKHVWKDYGEPFDQGCLLRGEPAGVVEWKWRIGQIITTRCHNELVACRADLSRLTDAIWSKRFDKIDQAFSTASLQPFPFDGVSMVMEPDFLNNGELDISLRKQLMDVSREFYFLAEDRAFQGENIAGCESRWQTFSSFETD